MSKTLAICLKALSAAPGVANAETYSETLECVFERGLANRPTPSRILLSLDEFGRSALLYEVEISEIETSTGSASVLRISYRVLSIAWPEKEYSYRRNDKTARTYVGAPEGADLHKLEFRVFLDRTTMKAIARSRSTGQRMRPGEAARRCKAHASHTKQNT